MWHVTPSPGEPHKIPNWLTTPGCLPINFVHTANYVYKCKTSRYSKARVLLRAQQFANSIDPTLFYIYSTKIRHLFHGFLCCNICKIGGFIAITVALTENFYESTTRSFPLPQHKRKKISGHRRYCYIVKVWKIRWRIWHYCPPNNNRMLTALNNVNCYLKRQEIQQCKKPAEVWWNHLEK